LNHWCYNWISLSPYGVRKDGWDSWFAVRSVVLLLNQYKARSSRRLISPLSSRLIITLTTSGEKWLRSIPLHHISIQDFLILFSHLHPCIQNGWYLNTKRVYYWLVKSICGKRFDYVWKFRFGVKKSHMKDWRILSCSSFPSVNFTEGRSLIIPDLPFNYIPLISTMVSGTIILATLTFVAN
jgi:hypothetical protein